MKRLPKIVYRTAEQIETCIAEREDAAMKFAPDSSEHRAIMQEIAKLRLYAEAKRWLSNPLPQEHNQPPPSTRRTVKSQPLSQRG